MEAFSFLPVEDEKIFTVAHIPKRRLGEGGILFIHPMLEEKLWAARATTRLARHLADAGMPVLRFDFRGHGDSDREHEETRLATIRTDLLAAAGHLRTSLGVSELHLFGIRFGGSIAAHLLGELDVSSIALVNPLSTGKSYLMNALRSNLTTQLSLWGKVGKDREALVSEMRETGVLNIDGYNISSDFFDEISAIDLSANPPSWSGAGMVLSLSQSSDAQPDIDSCKIYEAFLADNPASRLMSVQTAALWKEHKLFSVGSRELFDPLREWFLGDWRRAAA